MPAPNFIAGVMIGIANDSWLAVVFASVIWPLVFCAYVSIIETERRTVTVENFRERGRQLLFGSPVLTFYAIEFWTAMMTALTIGSISYLVKTLVS